MTGRLPLRYRMESADDNLLMLSGHGVEGWGWQMDGLKQGLNKSLLEM